MMVRTFHKKLACLFIITSSILCFPCYADQQTDKDDGVDFAKSLTGNVVDGARNTPASTVPGFTTIDLPETSYYSGQDLGGMQTDAQNLLTTGAVNDAAQFAYEQSTVPKLLFSDTDPLITNAGTIGTDAVLDPSVLSITTGDCATADVSSAKTSIEHCTAWMVPTTHTCSKTLDVQVTWNEVSNCSLGQGFAQNQSNRNWRDIMYGRAYCNPGTGDNLVDIQVHAVGQQGGCTGWSNIKVSTDQLLLTYTGVTLRPHWNSSCRYLPVFVQGTCDVDKACNYILKYYLLWPWSSSSDSPPYCSGTPMDLGSLGYTSVPFWNSVVNGEYCVAGSYAINLLFEKPNVVHTPTISESWVDGCGYLEAQVAP